MEFLGVHRHPKPPQPNARGLARSQRSSTGSFRDGNSSNSAGIPKPSSTGFGTAAFTPVRRGVFAVGRPSLTTHGKWMAAILACSPQAVLSHRTAARLWGFRPGYLPGNDDLIDVTVAAYRRLTCTGIRLHRARSLSEGDRGLRDRIPTTSPLRTLIDLAAVLNAGQLETAINEADRVGLVNPDALRLATTERSGLRGLAAIRDVLDRRTFRLTDSELERRFLRLVDRAGLVRPLTQQRVNGFQGRLLLAELRFIVETDGLRYHRTPTQQANDRKRDQRHVAAGFIAGPFHARAGDIRGPAGDRDTARSD